MGDISGTPSSTVGGTSPAVWNSVVAYNLEPSPSLAYSNGSLYGQTSATQFPYGFTTVGYEFIDKPVPPGSANVALCTFFVAIPVMGDTTPPQTETCPNDVFITVSNTSSQGIASWVEPVPLDNNIIVRRSWRSHAPDTLFLLGTTTVTYRWIDPSNPVTPLVCTFTVTVSTAGMYQPVSIKSEHPDRTGT